MHMHRRQVQHPRRVVALLRWVMQRCGATWRGGGLVGGVVLRTSSMLKLVKDRDAKTLCSAVGQLKLKDTNMAYTCSASCRGAQSQRRHGAVSASASGHARLQDSRDAVPTRDSTRNIPTQFRSTKPRPGSQPAGMTHHPDAEAGKVHGLALQVQAEAHHGQQRREEAHQQQPRGVGARVAPLLDAVPASVCVCVCGGGGGCTRALW